MTLISLKCPQCSGELSVEDNKDTYFCSYCGTKIAYKSEITNNVNPDTFFGRWANTVCTGGDITTATKRFKDLFFDDTRIKVIDYFQASRISTPLAYYSTEDSIIKSRVRDEWTPDNSTYVLNELIEWTKIIQDNVVDNEIKNTLLEFCTKYKSVVDEYNAKAYELYIIEKNRLDANRQNEIEKVKKRNRESKLFGWAVFLIIIAILLIISVVGTN